MKATNNIDLDNNEIKNLVLEKLINDPQTNIEAKIFYNTTEKKIKYNNGEEWKEIGREGGGGGLGAPDFDNAIALPRSPFPLNLTAPEDGYLYIHTTGVGRGVININSTTEAWSEFATTCISGSYDAATVAPIDGGRIFRVIINSASLVSLTFVPIKK